MPEILHIHAPATQSTYRPHSTAHISISVKNSPMGPVQIWSNITIVENFAFQEIMALTGARHIVSSKRVTVYTKMQ